MAYWRFSKSHFKKASLKKIPLTIVITLSVFFTRKNWQQKTDENIISSTFSAPMLVVLVVKLLLPFLGLHQISKACNTTNCLSFEDIVLLTGLLATRFNEVAEEIHGFYLQFLTKMIFCTILPIK